MSYFISKNKWSILILFTFVLVGYWYFFSNSNLYNEPEKADLVMKFTDID